MNILFISYDSYKYDGRLRELIKVAQELGEVTFITRDEGEEPINGQHILYKGSGYLKFISFCAKQAKKMQDVDTIFIDNRKGILPGYLAKRLTGATYVIQDCRELYDMKSAAGIPGRIGCLMEKIFTRHSDVVIAANAFRAKLMVKMFGLKKRPFNYENIRRLAYSSEERARQVEQECQEFFSEEKFRIISTAGCDMTRTTGKMIEAMKDLGEKYELLLIGDSEEEDEELAHRIIQYYGLTNVKILPRMDQDHLKYFIDHSQVGMVWESQMMIMHRQSKQWQSTTPNGRMPCIILWIMYMWSGIITDLPRRFRMHWRRNRHEKGNVGIWNQTGSNQDVSAGQ